MFRRWRLDAAIAGHIWKNRHATEAQRIIMGTYIGRWPFCLFAGHFKEGIRRRLYRPPYPKDCRPKLFGTFVTNKPVWPSNCPISQKLSERVQDIRAEFERLQPSYAQDINTRNLTQKGSWGKVHLISHCFKHEALDQCPTTRSILEAIPFCTALGSAYFSVMGEGTTVRPHCGPTNFRVRYHLGVDVPTTNGAWLQVGHDLYRWHEGHTLVFSDAYVHAVRIDAGIHRRVVLVVDAYHPELTLEERHFLEEIEAIHDHFFPRGQQGLHIQ